MEDFEKMTNNSAAAIAAGRAAATIEDRLQCFDAADEIPAVLMEANQRLEVSKDLVKLLEDRRPGPRRKQGTVTVHEARAFSDLVERYGTMQTILYADRGGSLEGQSGPRITAVLNDHSKELGDTDGAGSGAGWGDHRIVYPCSLSDAWKRWTGAAGKQHGQGAFADFLDANLAELKTLTDGGVTPPDMLKLARELEVNQDNKFKREIDPVLGTKVLRWESDTRAAYGKLEIPRAFGICIPVFEGGALYEIECRLQFVLNGGSPVFSFTLHQQAEILKAAFSGIVESFGDLGFPTVRASAPAPNA